ncbi:flagellar hook-length control protein FliK [Brevundimonas sp. VNH65]|uniref:flagellar hook-length control protein FliK n=1 Tax=Brevundimonas sp. VNH65 TaxID=3400917 RepID=UPI003BFFFE92
MFDVLSIAALAPVAPATGGADMSAVDSDFGVLMKAFAGEAGNGEAGSDPAMTVDVISAAGAKAAAPRPDAGVPLHLSAALTQDEAGPSASSQDLNDAEPGAEAASEPETAPAGPAMGPEAPKAEEPASTTTASDAPIEPSVASPVAFAPPPSAPIGPSLQAVTNLEAQVSAEDSPEAAAPVTPGDAGRLTEAATPVAPPLPDRPSASARTDVTPRHQPETVAVPANADAETASDKALTDQLTPGASTPDAETDKAGSRGGGTVATPADAKTPSTLAKALADAGVTRLDAKSAEPAKEVAEPSATGPQTGATERAATAVIRAAASSSSAPSPLIPTVRGSSQGQVSASAEHFGSASDAEPKSPAPSIPSPSSSPSIPTAATNTEVLTLAPNGGVAVDSRLTASGHREGAAQEAMIAAEGAAAPEQSAPVDQSKPAKAVSLTPALKVNDAAPRTPTDAVAPITSDTGVGVAGSTAGGTTSSTPATAMTSMLSSISAATAETTAALGAQILRRLDGRSTRFEIGLTPEGLGQVDVTLDIDAEGGLTARLAFDSPISAAELRGRADELRRQLQEAGFSVAQDALSFSERDAGQSGGGNGRSAREFLAESARAFAGAERLAEAAETALALPAWAARSLTPAGVDVKV